MPGYKLRIFSNVVIIRMEAETRTAEDIMIEYTKLTTVEVSLILAEVARRLALV
ncbi:hypothetical protein [Clostridium sp. CF012]|uniref:hypothetical protein n=1 Tax=Clostridium sp. CF012 TaxID=2843319 RepID=UPI001C0E714D|nr:hypothetical protein [Clostridium sp. CF012]MBU3146848.1 hypothetical protein [Clostridium sp. CF012]